MTLSVRRHHSPQPRPRRCLEVAHFTGRIRLVPNRSGDRQDACSHVSVRSAADMGTPVKALTAEQAEIQQLRRKNQILRMEREILKKATAFFAKESS